MKKIIGIIILCFQAMYSQEEKVVFLDPLILSSDLVINSNNEVLVLEISSQSTNDCILKGYISAGKVIVKGDVGKSILIVPRMSTESNNKDSYGDKKKTIIVSTGNMPPIDSIKNIQNDIYTYPLPFINLLALESANVAISKCVVYNLNGEKQLEEIPDLTDKKKVELNTSALNYGFYVLVTHFADGSITRRIINK